MLEGNGAKLNVSMWSIGSHNYKGHPLEKRSAETDNKNYRLLEYSRNRKHQLPRTATKNTFSGQNSSYLLWITLYYSKAFVYLALRLSFE